VRNGSDSSIHCISVRNFVSGPYFCNLNDEFLKLFVTDHPHIETMCRALFVRSGAQCHDQRTNIGVRTSTLLLHIGISISML